MLFKGFLGSTAFLLEIIMYRTKIFIDITRGRVAELVYALALEANGSISLGGSSPLSPTEKKSPINGDFFIGLPKLET